MLDTLDTRDRRTGAALDTLLERLPALGPEHTWEGSLIGATGNAAKSNIGIRAVLRFAHGLVEGTGRVSGLAQTRPTWDDSLEISGTRDGGVVHLQIWFAAAAFARSSFVLSGELSTDERQISGTWVVGCFDPPGCGCQGGGGTFRLDRVE